MKAGDWLKGVYKARRLLNAFITKKRYQLAQVVIVKDKAMKDIWCLACSLENRSLKTVKKYYSKRWSTECSYRDEKDFYSGLGVYKSRIKSVQRRDRMLAIVAIAIIILTFLGHVSEKLNLDKKLRSNTVDYRTHSLFNQGLYLFFNMLFGSDSYRKKMFREFEIACKKHAELNTSFGVI